jgi:hypothetical protein
MRWNAVVDVLRKREMTLVGNDVRAAAVRERRE